MWCQRYHSPGWRGRRCMSPCEINFKKYLHFQKYFDHPSLLSKQKIGTQRVHVSAKKVDSAGNLVNCHCHLSIPILTEFSKLYCNHIKQKFCHLLFTLGNVNYWVTYTKYLRNMHYCRNESIIYRLDHWIVDIYNSIPILCTVNDIAV